VAAIGWAFRPQPLAVDLAPVSRGDLRDTIDEQGKTRVRERYVVTAPVAGRLQRVELAPGDPVEAHRTILATFLPVSPTPLDPRMRAEAEARVKALQARRDEARVTAQHAQDELAFSRNELIRQRQLASGDGISQQQLTAYEFETQTKASRQKAADLELAAAEHELNAAQALLRRVPDVSDSRAGVLTLRSPVDGVVLRVVQENETQVPPGMPLIEVGSPAQLELVSDLLSADAVKVRPGMAVLIDGWGGELTLCGRVRLIEPAGFTKVSALGVEEQRVNVVIDFDSPLPDRGTLGDGYRVEISIVVVERQGILKIPTSALFRTGNEWTVFASRNDRAVRTNVKIGERNAVEAEVTAGLVEGEKVIVHPGEGVDDGVAVVAR
jgi:HlyD family secretion protein